MRKLLLVLLLIILAGNINKSFSWDTTAAKYLPLQIGNVWVYRGDAQAYIMNGRSYKTYKVIGTLDSLGKRYYLLQVSIVMISGTISSGVFHFSYPIRIDSVTMNVYNLQPDCNRNEMLIDSLRARLNDSTIICRQMYFAENSKLIDTSAYFIFNNSFPAKKYNEFYGPIYTTVYAKGIGIVNYRFAYQMNQCLDTLRGCVINGVLYGDTSTVVGIHQINSEVPLKFSLLQNYPNPFNPITNVKFQIPKSGFAKLIVFDVLGKEVKILVNQQLSPGIYEAN